MGQDRLRLDGRKVPRCPPSAGNALRLTREETWASAPGPLPVRASGNSRPLCARGASGSDPGEGSRDARYLRGGARWIYLEHFSLPRLLVRVLLTALLAVVLALPLRPDFRGPPLELPATLSALG